MLIARLTLTGVVVVLRYFASGNALRNPAAVVDDTNAAVRAFCSETSVPNTGASRVRAIARTSPCVSTNLRAGAIRDVERRLQNRPHFILRQRCAADERAICAGARRVAQRVRCIHEYERIATGIVDVAIRPNTRRGLTERRACPDHAVEVTRDRDQCANGARERGERRGRRRVAAQLIELDVAEAQRLAVRGDAVATTVDGRGEVERRGITDRFVDILVVVGDVLVDRVEPIGQDADSAHDGPTLI
jgi:hypothetical protein